MRPTSREDLESRLRERMHALLEASPAVGLLISWTIAGRGPLIGQLRRGRLAAELLQGLRSDYGYRSPAAWSVSLEVEISETLPPEWYEQETIRGDFLRAVRQLQMNPDEPLALGRVRGRDRIWPARWRGGGRFRRQGRPRPRAARGGRAGRRPAERGGAPRMKITDLEIDGYGVWSGLRIEKLSDALNVLYGPNEAGKTTLLAIHPLDALRLFARAAAIFAAGPRRAAGRSDRPGRPARPVRDRPLRRFAARRHARRAAHADRARRHPPRRAFHQGAAVERRRAGVQQRVRRRSARDSRVGHARATPRPPNCSTACRPDWTAFRWSKCCGNWRPRATASSTRPASRARWSNCWPSGKNCAAEIEELGAINRRYGHLVAERDQLHAGNHAVGGRGQPARTPDPRDGPGRCAARSLGASGPPWTSNCRRLGPLRGHARGGHRAARRRQRPHPETPTAARPSCRGCARPPSGSLPRWRSTRPCGARPRGSRPSRSKSRGSPSCRARSANCRARSASSESELAAEGERLGLKSETGALPAFSAKTLASLRSPAKPVAAVPPARWRKRKQAAATAQRNRRSRLREQIESALAARGEHDLAAAMDRAGQPGFAAPPPRATRRAARSIGPLPNRTGGAKPAAGRSPSAAGRRAGRARRGVRRRRGAGAGRAVHAGVDHRLGRLGTGRAGAGRQRRRRRSAR